MWNPPKASATAAGCADMGFFADPLLILLYPAVVSSIRRIVRSRSDYQPVFGREDRLAVAATSRVRS